MVKILFYINFDEMNYEPYLNIWISIDGDITVFPCFDMYRPNDAIEAVKSVVEPKQKIDFRIVDSNKKLNFNFVSEFENMGFEVTDKSSDKVDNEILEIIRENFESGFMKEKSEKTNASFAEQVNIEGERHSEEHQNNRIEEKQDEDEHREISFAELMRKVAEGENNNE